MSNWKVPVRQATMVATPRRYSILITDDDRGVRETLGEIVEARGLRPVLAEDGEFGRCHGRDSSLWHMPARRRLLVLNQYYWPGVEATAHLLTELCEALAETHEVTVLTGAVRGKPLREERNVARNAVLGLADHSGVDQDFTQAGSVSFLDEYSRAAPR